MIADAIEAEGGIGDNDTAFETSIEGDIVRFDSFDDAKAIEVAAVDETVDGTMPTEARGAA